MMSLTFTISGMGVERVKDYISEKWCLPAMKVKLAVCEYYEFLPDKLYTVL